MKNILVLVGASNNALKLLQYAIDFAQSFEAKLFIIKVCHANTKTGPMKSFNASLEQESKSYLTSLVSQLDSKGVEIIIKTVKGNIIRNIQLTCKVNHVDLILIEPKTNSIKENVYLGKTSGKIIKQTKTPTLIIPEGYVFKPVCNVLVAVKSTIIKKKNALKPLVLIKNNFKGEINLLLVKTPSYKNGDFNIKKNLGSLVSNVVESKNTTTYQGIIEHDYICNPDILCVIRRKRGFFKKKWGNNSILKIDFYSDLPVLIINLK